MIYLVENGVARRIGEAQAVSSGAPGRIGEIYAVAGGTPRLVYSSAAEIALLGAPGETVSFTGPVSGSVALDENGDAALTLRPGVYTFTGSISGTRENLRLSRGGRVTLWPENVRILYWHGRFGLLDDGVTKQSITERIASGSFSNGWVIRKTNAIELIAQARYYQSRSTGVACVHFQPVSYAGYSKLVYEVSGRDVSSYATPRTSLGQKGEIGTGECPHRFTANGSYAYDIDPALPYVCANAYDNGESYTSYSSAQFDIEAVYLRE